MGTSFRNVVSTVCLICILFVLFTIGQDGVEDVKTKVQRRRKIEKSKERPACSIGDECPESVKSREPKFINRFTFVEVNAEHYKYGVPLQYNHTVYMGFEECPCHVFEYSITDIEDVMEPDNPQRFSIFDIDSDTGKIRLTKDILSSDLYRLTVHVKNLYTDKSDQTIITVARVNPLHDQVFTFETDNGNGYGEEHNMHNRHKRSVVPDEVNFTLTQDNNLITTMRVGTRVNFTLDILFPGGPTDISVELFTPDSTTTVMILCDVVVDSIGDNLGTGWSGNITYDHRSESYQPDMAVIDFGTVVNNQSDIVNVAASTITIKYTAVMIENPLTQNTEYWISAGAEYLSENYIWVGMASITAIIDGDQNITKVPTFNVDMPLNVALGSSYPVLVEMFLPYPYRHYVFKVFTPADTVGVMSVCAIRFNGLASNFGCGNDVSQINASTVTDPQAAGNAIGVLDFGYLLNKASRDDPVSILDSDNNVSLTMILHMYPDLTKVGQLLSVGLALEIDDQSIWIGSSNFTVNPAVTTANDLTDIVIKTVSSSLNSNLDDASVGVPFTLTFELEVPTPTTPNVATQYILEIIAPFDGSAPIFSVCSFEVISIGKDMPCLIKEDLVTEYSSRVSGDSPLEPDRAKIDLGYVTNLEIATIPDNFITVQAILKPLATSTFNSVNSKHNVSFSVKSGPSAVQLLNSAVTIQNPASITSMSNNTAPSFTMSFYDNTDVVSVMGSTKVVVDMVTVRNITYDEMDMEFLMPVGSYGGENYTYFHVCRVDISFNGKNMPCMTPEWYAKMIEYFSQFDNYEMDRAKLNIGGMCNYQFEDDTLQDKTSFEIFLKVLDREDLTHMTSKMVSTGLQYSSQNLWVGQLRLNVSRGTANENVTPTKSTYSILSRNTTMSPIPLGLAVSYSMLVKIARGDRAHIRVRASAQQEIAHICTVRVFSAGSNLPCVVDEVVKRTYTNWPSGSGRQIVELDLGIVNNFGSSAENMTANNYFDEDSMIIETLVRANPSQSAGTATVAISVYYNTAMTMKSTYTMTDFVTTEDTSGVSTTVTDPVEVTTSVGEITGNLDNTTDIAIGEVKRVLINAVIPEDSSYDLAFSFTITSAFANKLEMCDAAIVSVGDNLPCIDILTEAEITSSAGVFNDSAMFNLGFLCSRPLRPGDRRANTVVFEAYVRLLDNGHTLDGETVSVATAIKTFLNEVEIDTVDFIANDGNGFMDKVFDSVIDSFTNETLISINQSSPLMMNIAENVTIKANVTVPKLSVSKVLFDVSLPIEDTACLTISEIRIIGSVGRNVLCVPPEDNLKGIVYSPNFNATKGNSQVNYVYVDIGIVTNTGLTHRRKTFMPGDDDLVIEFDIQMADCASSDNGKIYKLSIGNKIATVIFIYDFDIQVVRNGNEKPNIDMIVDIGATSTSTEIILKGIVFHNESSTAEGRNSSFFLSLPAYQHLASGELTITSDQSCSVPYYSDNAALLHIICSNFFFTDVLTFEARILVNSSVILPDGFSAVHSVAQGWVVTEYISRYSTYDAQDWFPHPISGEIEIKYSVEAGIDVSEMISFGLSDNAVVADCQFFSTGDSGIALNARLNNAGAWTPIFREDKFARNRYLVVYLGNQHKFSRVAIQQNEGHTHTVTEVTVEYTNDAQSWFGREVVDLSTSPSDLENKTLNGRTARGVRITITNDTSNGAFADVGVKFEFYGQKLTSDVTQQEACDTLSASRKKPLSGYPDFKTRSFVEDKSTGTAFVCDRIISSKKDDTECKWSVDGNTWSKIDKKVACMLGFESVEGQLYAYAQNKMSIMTKKQSDSWRTVTYETYQAELTKTTWTYAIGIPEVYLPELDRTTPHSNYRINTWGATIHGMYKNNVQKLKWADSS